MIVHTAKWRDTELRRRAAHAAVGCEGVLSEDKEHDGYCDAVFALLTTRERDAAIGALRDGLKACAALDEMLACHRVGRPPTEAMWKRINAARAWIRSARLALEQGTPATREETP